ncbi:hypothetical protein OQA88_10012 [Cercophora sp. LCS_1]
MEGQERVPPSSIVGDADADWKLINESTNIFDLIEKIANNEDDAPDTAEDAVVSNLVIVNTTDAVETIDDTLSAKSPLCCSPAPAATLPEGTISFFGTHSHDRDMRLLKAITARIGERHTEQESAIKEANTDLETSQRRAYAVQTSYRQEIAYLRRHANRQKAKLRQGLAEIAELRSRNASYRELSLDLFGEARLLKRDIKDRDEVIAGLKKQLARATGQVRDLKVENAITVSQLSHAISQTVKLQKGNEKLTKGKEVEQHEDASPIAQLESEVEESDIEEGEITGPHVASPETRPYRPPHHKDHQPLGGLGRGRSFPAIGEKRIASHPPVKKGGDSTDKRRKM